MDEYEKAVRLALFEIARKIAQDAAASIDWDAVLQLTHQLTEMAIDMPPKAEMMTREVRQEVAADTARITTQLLRDKHIIGGMIPGVMMLVFRCFTYSAPLKYRELGIKVGKKEIGRVEALILRMWADYWEHFEGSLTRDPRGATGKWNAATLMSAINRAAPTVPSSRWSHDAVAEKITEIDQLEKPLTGAALRMLVTRKGLAKFWKQWEGKKQKKKRT